MASDITISKKDISVTVYVSEVTDAMNNKLFPITPGTGKQNQDGGPKDTKIIDLLRVVREINVTRGMITGTSVLTATQVKDNLISIFKGATAKGGVCTLTYDGNSFTGYLEKLSFTEKSSDEPPTPTEDITKYDVQLNFIVGIAIGS